MLDIVQILLAECYQNVVFEIEICFTLKLIEAVNNNTTQKKLTTSV